MIDMNVGTWYINRCLITKQSIHSHPVAMADRRLYDSDELQKIFDAVIWLDYKVDTIACPLSFYVRRYKTISDLFINEQIRDKEVRVVGPDGEALGVMLLQDARKAAEDAGVDLVKIAPNAKPPVCKIVDYSKYKYEQLQKAKEAKKKQKIVDIKEIRLSPNIDTNDLNTKVGAAKKFLAKGNRVKITLRFRGREMAHMETDCVYESGGKCHLR